MGTQKGLKICLLCNLGCLLKALRINGVAQRNRKLSNGLMIFKQNKKFLLCFANPVSVKIYILCHGTSLKIIQHQQSCTFFFPVSEILNCSCHHKHCMSAIVSPSTTINQRIPIPFWFFSKRSDVLNILTNRAIFFHSGTQSVSLATAYLALCLLPPE